MFEVKKVWPSYLSKGRVAKSHSGRKSGWKVRVREDILTSKPVLGLPDYNQPFILATDASGTGIGAVLSQANISGPPERVISYYSRSLSPAERNYSITELEALAMVKAIEHYRPYLFGRKFTVVTDH